jgi:hypothetical protein
VKLKERVRMAEKQDIERARDASLDEGQVAAEKQMRDIGAQLYLEVQQFSREELEAERRVVLRKIDWVIMPMVSIFNSGFVELENMSLSALERWCLKIWFTF